MTHYDLAIIGSGSGNSLVTPDFDDKKVVIIERNAQYGGTCLNVGCIPTKMFVHVADVARTIRDSARFGVDSTLDGVRWADIRDRVFGRIDPISAGGLEYRQNGANTDALIGEARFTGLRQLTVATAEGEVEVTADQVVIAAGARPVIPEVVADAGIRVETSDTVMRLDELPESMVILGGGFIACEFAHVFSALGVRVTLVNRGQRLLRHLDDEISEAFTAYARTLWDVRLGADVVAVCETGDGAGRRITLEMADGTTAEGGVLLVATGRVPNGDTLDLEAGGVAVHDDGRVRVDEFGRTSADGVWALGDVSSPWQLKHVANDEARAVAHNLVYPTSPKAVNHEHVPSAVFTHPQIATVGLTEAQARAAGHDVTVKTQRFADVAYGWALEDEVGLCKIVADRQTRQVLGAHIMGEQASSLIHSVVQGMAQGLTVMEMARGQYWIHPALTEVVENALLGLDIVSEEAVLETPVDADAVAQEAESLGVVDPGSRP